MTKITAYAINCDVIGHYDMADPDISFERYGLKLQVPKVINQKKDPIKIHSPFFEPQFSLKLTETRPESRVPLRMVPLKNENFNQFKTCPIKPSSK